MGEKLSEKARQRSPYLRDMLLYFTLQNRLHPGNIFLRNRDFSQKYVKVFSIFKVPANPSYYFILYQ